MPSWAARPMGWVGGWLVLGNLLVALVLCVATALSLQATRSAERARAAEVADNLAHSVSIEVGAELRLVDNALASIAQRLPTHPEANTPATIQGLAAAIREQAPRVPFVSTIHFVDRQGRISPLPRGQASRQIDDLGFLQQVLASDTPVLSPPRPSPAVGEWAVMRAQRVMGPDGQPCGILVAEITSDQFAQAFSRLALGPQDIILLRDRSLRMVAQHMPSRPANTDGLGTTQISPELRSLLARQPAAGTYSSRLGRDGVERIYAYREVPGYPLLLIAGLSSEQYFVPWRATAWRHWSFTALIILLVILGSVYLYLQRRREQEALRYAKRLARQQALMIENDWVGILRLHKRRIIWTNQALTTICGHEKKDLVGADTRLLYPDDASYAAIGQEGHHALRERGNFHTQIRMRHRNGELIWVDLSGTALSEDESVWMLIDISGLKHSEAQAHHMALHDALTGLANRRSLDERLREALAWAQREQRAIALAYMDLDGFKSINDQHGHEAGDAVLRQVAERLAARVRGHDLVARLGGDEFAIVLADTTSAEEVSPILERCLSAIQAPMTLPDGATVQVRGSLGVVFGPVQADTPEALLTAADAAMYEAKRQGKGRMVFANATHLVTRH